MLLLHWLLAKINFTDALAIFCYFDCFCKKWAGTKKLAAGTKKWSAETKSDFITTFLLGWPSEKVFEHKIPGIKKSSTKIENLYLIFSI